MHYHFEIDLGEREKYLDNFTRWNDGMKVVHPESCTRNIAYHVLRVFSYRNRFTKVEFQSIPGMTGPTFRSEKMSNQIPYLFIPFILLNNSML